MNKLLGQFQWLQDGLKNLKYFAKVAPDSTTIEACAWAGVGQM